MDKSLQVYPFRKQQRDLSLRGSIIDEAISLTVSETASSQKDAPRSDRIKR